MEVVHAMGTWRLIPGHLHQAHDWVECVAVYSSLSGDTHLIDQVSGELLGALSAKPLPTAVLCQHIADFLDISNDDSVATRVAQLLKQLDELGLVEPTA